MACGVQDKQLSEHAIHLSQRTQESADGDVNQGSQEVSFDGWPQADYLLEFTQHRIDPTDQGTRTMKTRLSIIALAAAMLTLPACISPFTRTEEKAMREQLIASQQKYLSSVTDAQRVIIDRAEPEIEKKLAEAGFLEELEEKSGPSSYEEEPLEPGQDLLVGEADDKTDIVTISLQEALHKAARNNLDIALARLQPAISEAQLAQAEAVFDAVYFADWNLSKLDTPSPGSALAGFGSTQSRDYTFRTGVRKSLSTGGSVEVATEAVRQTQSPTFRAVETFDSANLAVSLNQPLLRNFGSDVANAEIYLNRNARDSDIQRLRQTIIDVVTTTEQAYWELEFARYQLLARQRLLRRALSDRSIIIDRAGFDGAGEPQADANAFVAQRRADIVNARNALRQASDRLKALINDPDLPLSGETLILPANQPADAPVAYSLLDAVTTALRNRPEMQVRLLDINDATIRQRVADNQRLPELNLSATIRYNGVGETHGDAYDQITDGQFIDYLVGFQFEQSIGNRGPEAQFRRFQLERQAAVVAYQREARDVVEEVKNSLRDMVVSYEQIGLLKEVRLAAAENARIVQTRLLEDRLTPEFVDRKLRRDESLTIAEINEYQALTSYNASVARFYRAVGTLLERNGIDFEYEDNYE